MNSLAFKPKGLNKLIVASKVSNDWTGSTAIEEEEDQFPNGCLLFST